MPDAVTGCITHDDAKRYYSRFFFSVVAFEAAGMIAAYVLGFAVSALVSVLAPSLLESGVFVSVVNYVLNIVAIYGLAMPVFCLAAAPLPTARPNDAKMGAKNWILGLCLCFFAMWAGSYISNLVTEAFSQLRGAPLQNPVDTMITEENLWVDVIFLAFITPVLEEIFFRKVLTEKLLPLGEGYAVFISAAIFGLSHGNLFQFCYAAFVGFVLAFVYVKTGKLRYSISYHVIINLFGGVIVPWIVRNVDYEGLMAVLEEFSSTSAENMEELTQRAMPYIMQTIPLLIYSIVEMVLVVIGAVIFIKAVKRKQFSFDKGLLSPLKEKTASNIMMNAGAVALVACYALMFVLSVI